MEYEELINRCLLKVKKSIGLLLPCIALYVLIGCILFPAWWFYFIYRSGYRQPAQWISFVEDFRITPITAWSIVVAIIICIYILYRFRHTILKATQHSWLIICKVSIALIVIALFVVSFTQGRKFIFIDSMVDYAINMSAISIAPKLNPPIYFYYLDDIHIESLYGQMQPDLEKNKISLHSGESMGATGQATLGNFGMSGQIATDSSLTTEYAKVPYASSRKALEVLRNLIDKGHINVYTTYPEWRAVYLTTYLKEQACAILDSSGKPDYFKALSSKMFGDVDKINPENIDKEFIKQIQKVNEFVLLASKIEYEDAKCSKVVIRATFEIKSPVVKFVIPLPEQWKTMRLDDCPMGFDVRVFGVVIKSIDATGCIYVRPIAIFK